jgi:hypothetical protein
MTDFSVADPRDPGQLDVIGFDAALPQLIRNFALLQFSPRKADGLERKQIGIIGIKGRCRLIAAHIGELCWHVHARNVPISRCADQLQTLASGKIADSGCWICLRRRSNVDRFPR